MNRNIADTADARSVCRNCPTRTSGLCKALIDASLANTDEPPRAEGRLSANLYLQRKDESVSDFKILKGGWAAMVRNSASGDRLIANFMLPGDVIGIGVWMNGSPFYSVQAVSEVTFCSFDPQHISGKTSLDYDILRHFLSRASRFNEQTQRRLFDIAKRDAEARILSLLLGLYERQEAQGAAKEGSMPLPLRQHHLADATGLTQVHVSRVLRKLREDNVLKLSRNVLTFNQLSSVRERLA